MQKIITGSAVKVGRCTRQGGEKKKKKSLSSGFALLVTHISLAIDCLTVVFNEIHRWSREDLLQTNYSAGVRAS